MKLFRAGVGYEWRLYLNAQGLVAGWVFHHSKQDPAAQALHLIESPVSILNSRKNRIPLSCLKGSGVAVTGGKPVRWDLGRSSGAVLGGKRERQALGFGLWAGPDMAWGGRKGKTPVGVGNDFGAVTQGSSCLATLG